LQEEECGLGGASVLGKVRKDPSFFLATEWWVRQNDIDAITLANLRQPKP
jgi:hypothetical protein